MEAKSFLNCGVGKALVNASPKLAADATNLTARFLNSETLLSDAVICDIYMSCLLVVGRVLRPLHSTSIVLMKYSWVQSRFTRYRTFERAQIHSLFTSFREGAIFSVGC